MHRRWYRPLLLTLLALLVLAGCAEAPPASGPVGQEGGGTPVVQLPSQAPPEATPLPEPTSSPSPAPTKVPSPTATMAPTATLAPTAAATATGAPTATPAAPTTRRTSPTSPSPMGR